MEAQQETQEPRLVQIYDGWQAHGDGWAVYGATREDAIENYWKAVKRHQEILAMPRQYSDTVSSGCWDSLYRKFLIYAFSV
jgi:hypothetical protein